MLLKVLVKTDFCVSIIYVYALLFISDFSKESSVLVQTGYKNMNSVLPKIIFSLKVFVSCLWHVVY